MSHGNKLIFQQICDILVLFKNERIMVKCQNYKNLYLKIKTKPITKN